jgi:4-diphosphocytidyl-2C-methyl-D-erythritol kinase
MKVKSPAKINLTLDILKKFGEYHLVDTILHEIDLHDELIFKQIPENKIIIRCDNPKVPTGHTNTVYAAIQLLKPYLKGRPDFKVALPKKPGLLNLPGLQITIKKNIPVASGLGGGSGNAAVTLKSLNKLWNLNLSNKKLQQLAAKIGMDVPFFINGGTAFGTHYGEKITPLPKIKLPPHLIVSNSDKLSTKDIYAAIDLKKTGKNNSKTKQLLKNNLKNNSLFHNDFETAPPSAKNQSLQKKLLQLGADVVHICGSGPALYALFRTDNQLLHAFKELKGQVRFIWKSH